MENERDQWHGEWVTIKSLAQHGMHLHTYTARIVEDYMLIFNVYRAPDLNRLEKRYKDVDWKQSSINGLNIPVMLMQDETTKVYRIDWDAMKAFEALTDKSIVQETKKMSKFNPRDHMTDLRGKDYLEVKWRLVWFREEHPKGIINTEVVSFDPLVMKATILDENGAQLSSGHGSALAKPGAVWSGREIEKAETAAIGRALAHAGYGTQFDADDESDNIVDAPIQRNTPKNAPQRAPARQAASNVTDIRNGLGQAHNPPIGRTNDDAPAKKADGAWQPDTTEFAAIVARIKPYKLTLDQVVKHAGFTAVAEFGSADAVVEYAHSMLEDKAS